MVQEQRQGRVAMVCSPEWMPDYGRPDRLAKGSDDCSLEQ